MNERPSEVGIAVLRGLGNACPSCGRGRLMSGYLSVNPECEVCNAPLARYPAADGPAFFTMTIMLLLLIPFLAFLWGFRPSPLMFFVLAFGFTTVVTLVLLRLVKGAFIGYLWALNERDRGA